MITFVDTNILLDVFLPDPEFGAKSKAGLSEAYSAGSIVINEIVYAELAPQFPSKELLDDTLRILGIRAIQIDLESAYDAGMKWKEHLMAGGKRNRVLADFLVGAHAKKVADRFMTRDRGFYKQYFSELRLCLI